MSFFALSKILWYFFRPSHFALLILGVGLLLSLFKKAGLGIKCIITACIFFIVFGVTSVGYNAMVYLERQHPEPVGLPKVTGIILLSGIFDNKLSEARNTPSGGAAFERISTFQKLAKMYPDARLVVSGGSGKLDQGGKPEAYIIRDHLRSTGFKDGRVIYETLSKNTYENALNVQKIINPKPEENWIVVTSSWHLPRTAAIFKKLDWNITTFPADYRTYGQYKLFSPYNLFTENLELTDTAFKEFVGLIAYCLTGKADCSLGDKAGS